MGASLVARGVDNVLVAFLNASAKNVIYDKLCATVH